ELVEELYAAEREKREVIEVALRRDDRIEDGGGDEVAPRHVQVGRPARNLGEIEGRTVGAGIVPARGGDMQSPGLHPRGAGGRVPVREPRVVELVDEIRHSVE